MTPAELSELVEGALLGVLALGLVAGAVLWWLDVRER